MHDSTRTICNDAILVIILYKAAAIIYDHVRGVALRGFHGCVNYHRGAKIT